MSMKGVIIVDNSLPAGLQANIPAVLSLSVGKAFPEIVGHDVNTKEGVVYRGITRIPLPILQTSSENLKDLHEKAEEEGLYSACFTNMALATKSYNDYEEKVSNSKSTDLIIHGLAIYGEKKSINRISGNLGLLK
ncbi:DUF2000 domain-containing protein [Halomonas sp. Y3]|uniref:DUF2000 domain-containing protein n=1 Tax=Halomonas sp. Y3 TaxID=2956797 RepID=UPI00209D4570|nr:DUF2000 domain-containing protein [Halomonas sp. Y3]